MRVGALCAGYGGLELGLGHDPIWVSETDPHASAVLAARFPDAPNLGDLTELDDPPPVDLITAGFPCQPVSTAGQRAGIHDERWLIDDIVEVVRRSGARAVVLENVLGLLTANDGDAMARVCSALAGLGFDAEWTVVRASDIGACHQRARWFCVASDADGDGHPPVGRIETVRRDADRCDAATFGPYLAAIQRWERVIGRPAPNPLVDRRLAPRFVEWMQGLPGGWVTDIITNRPQALRVLGNGVVPQQAAYAIEVLCPGT